MRMRFAALVILFSWAVASDGMMLCLNSLHDSPIDNIIKVNIIGPKDTRMSYEDLAAWYTRPKPPTREQIAAVYQTFSGVGRIVCDGGGGTGLLTIKGNLMVTAAHIFYKKDCSQRVKNFSDCYFHSLTPEGLGKKYYVDPSTLRVGSKCPSAIVPRNDWAVIKLKTAVPGARPFQIGSNCTIKAGMSGMHVAALADNFGDQNNPRPYVDSCNVLGIPPPGFFQSCCSSGEGSSGSAFGCYRRDGLFLAGIINDSLPDSYDYQACSSYNNSYGTPVNGDFLRAIDEAAASAD